MPSSGYAGALELRGGIHDRGEVEMMETLEKRISFL